MLPPTFPEMFCSTVGTHPALIGMRVQDMSTLTKVVISNIVCHARFIYDTLVCHMALKDLKISNVTFGNLPDRDNTCPFLLIFDGLKARSESSNPHLPMPLFNMEQTRKEYWDGTVDSTNDEMHEWLAIESGAANISWIAAKLAHLTMQKVYLSPDSRQQR